MTPELEALIAKARAYVDSLTPEEYAEMIRVQRESYVRSEMLWGDEGTTTVIRPTREEKEDHEQ